MNHEPSKPGVLLKQRQNVLGMFVRPKSAFVAAAVLVMCRIRGFHGYTPNPGTPPIDSQDDTMNQVGGEFKTKIGNLWQMSIAAAKQGREELLTNYAMLQTTLSGHCANEGSFRP